jgi:hypothetical protein
MKKTASLLTSIVLFNLIQAQVPDVMWELVYEPQLSMGREVAKTLDSCYVVTATNSTFDNGLTLKLDPMGNIIWTSEYGGFSITPTIDSSYIIAGGSDPYNAFLRKIDKNGNSIWYENYGAGGQHEFYCVIQCADSGIMAGGYSCLEGKNIYLLKIDLDGNVIWERHFNTENFGMVRDAVEHEGFIYLLCDYEHYTWDWQTLIAKIDSDGYTVWDSLYDICGMAMIIGHDNNLIITGCSEIMKFSLEGELIWTSLQNLQFDFLSIATTTDFGYILSGSGLIGNSYHSALIAKVDSVGNLLWNQFYSIPGIPYWNDFSSITVGFDQSYVVCGFAEYNSDTKLRILKTNPDPNLITYLPDISVKKELLIFPNPTKGKFTVSMKDIKKVEVYNLAGEKIMEQRYNCSNFDLSLYPKGIYFIKMAYQGNTAIRKIILQ